MDNTCGEQQVESKVSVPPRVWCSVLHQGPDTLYCISHQDRSAARSHAKAAAAIQIDCSAGNVTERVSGSHTQKKKKITMKATVETRDAVSHATLASLILGSSH